MDSTPGDRGIAKDRDARRPPTSVQRFRAGPGDPPCRLFHPRQDISERTNLYAEQPEIVAQLRQLLRQVQGRDAPDAPVGPGGRNSE